MVFTHLLTKALTKKINAERKKLYEFIPDVTYIQPSLKPCYFREAFEYNSKIAKAEAQRGVNAAAEKGISLNFNVVFQEFKAFNGIYPEADYEVCLHRFEAKQLDITVDTPPETMTYDCYGVPNYMQAGLTDEEKAIFESMYEYASSNGMPTSQIDELVLYYSGDKSMRQYFNMPPQSLREYLGQLVKLVDEGYESNQWYKSKRFDLSVLDILLKNFDTFEQAAKKEMSSERA
jgi:hypothetical protein